MRGLRWIWPDIPDESRANSVLRVGFLVCLVLAILSLLAVPVGTLWGLPLLAIAVGLFGVTGAQFLVMAWLNSAPLPWLWGNICVFFFSVAILMPNASVIALDPMPRIAGVASSIMGTVQNTIGASSAILGAAIYDGSIRNSIIILASSATLIVIVFLLKPAICPGPLVHHPDELARD